MVLVCRCVFWHFRLPEVGQKCSKAVIFQNMDIYEISIPLRIGGRLGPFRVSQILPCVYLNYAFKSLSSKQCIRYFFEHRRICVRFCTLENRHKNLYVLTDFNVIIVFLVHNWTFIAIITVKNEKQKQHCKKEKKVIIKTA